ncbi:MAG: hypothetical protein CSA95_01800 [Bacteroidetes bacterium]|nr:MAG: hypothetical protein CSA95_01800 [Bacteroidota bacterium]
MRFISLYLALFLLIMASSLSSCSVSKQPILLQSTDEISYDFNQLTQNCVVLIYSYECGYSLQGIPKYNKLKEELSHIEGLQFVAFAEQSLEESIARYPENVEVLTHDLNWIKFVGYNHFYEKIWRKNVFPEFIYFKNGKRKKTLIAPYDHELIEFKQYILKKNKTS